MRRFFHTFIILFIFLLLIFATSKSIRDNINISSVYTPDKTFYVPTGDRDLPKRDAFQIIVDTYKKFNNSSQRQVNQGSPVNDGFSSTLPEGKRWENGMVV